MALTCHIGYASSPHSESFLGRCPCHPSCGHDRVWFVRSHSHGAALPAPTAPDTAEAQGSGTTTAFGLLMAWPSQGLWNWQTHQLGEGLDGFKPRLLWQERLQQMFLYFIVWQTNAMWEERKIEPGKGHEPFWAAPTDGAMHNKMTQVPVSEPAAEVWVLYEQKKEEILLEMRNTKQTNMPKKRLRIEYPHRALWGACRLDWKYHCRWKQIPRYQHRLDEKQPEHLVCTLWRHGRLKLWLMSLWTAISSELLLPQFSFARKITKDFWYLPSLGHLF